MDRVTLFLCLLVFGSELHKAEFVTKDEFLSLEQDVKDLTEQLGKLISLMGTTPKQQELGNALQNETIEERVAILEFQVSGLNEEVTSLNTDVIDLGDEIDIIDGEIAVIFADQTIQDERILDLEDSIVGFEESVNALVMVDEALDSELAALNESLIQAMVDIIDLDERLSQMEINGTIAFYVTLPPETIPVDTVIVFQTVNLNIGNGYNSTTGEFTVLPGGAGLYFLYAHALVSNGEFAGFLVRRNGTVVCRAFGDDTAGSDPSTATCGAAAMLEEGDVVDVFMDEQEDNTPLVVDGNSSNSFTGFRITPQ